MPNFDGGEAAATGERTRRAVEAANLGEATKRITSCQPVSDHVRLQR